VGPARHVALHLRQAIHDGTPINLYHLGFVKRDYSYIDDIVAGTLAVLDKPPTQPGHRSTISRPRAARNPRRHRAVREGVRQGGQDRAQARRAGRHAGDLGRLTDTMRDFDWQPKVSVEEGVPKFVEWFKAVQSAVTPLLDIKNLRRAFYGLEVPARRRSRGARRAASPG
jgi:UDP-glucuronate 4-epimerase